MSVWWTFALVFDLVDADYNVYLATFQLDAQHGHFRLCHIFGGFPSPWWTWPKFPTTLFWLILVSLIFIYWFLQVKLSGTSMMWLWQPCRVWQSHHACLHRSRHSLMSGNWQTRPLWPWQSSRYLYYRQLILLLPARAFFWKSVLSAYVELVFPSHVS